MIKDFSIKSFQNILVTGGSGFIGGYLIRKLLNETNSNIFNIDKMGYASNHKAIDQILNLDTQKAKRYKLINIDLKNYELTNKAIIDCNPDLIMHLAAESHVD